LNSACSCSENTTKRVYESCFPVHISRVLVSITRRG
jgi:hypothetical protein